MEYLILSVKSGDVGRFKFMVVVHMNTVTNNFGQLARCLVQYGTMEMIEYLIARMYNLEWIVWTMMTELLRYGNDEHVKQIIDIYCKSFDITVKAVPLHLINKLKVLQQLHRYGWRLRIGEMIDAIQHDLQVIVEWCCEDAATNSYGISLQYLYARYCNSRRMSELLHKYKIHGVYETECDNGTCVCLLYTSDAADD